MRHLLRTRDLTRDEAIHILDIALDMAAVQNREVKKLPTLRGKTVVNLFFEDSTRTRISFEAAAKRLSADVINFSARGSSISKGESLKDTAQPLQALGADGVVIRHPVSGAPQVLAVSGWITAGVINAGDGTHEHPTQGLLDAFTIRQRVHGAGARGRGLDGGRGVGGWGGWGSSLWGTSCTRGWRDPTCGCSRPLVPTFISSHRRRCYRWTHQGGRSQPSFISMALS